MVCIEAYGILSATSLYKSSPTVISVSKLHKHLQLGCRVTEDDDATGEDCAGSVQDGRAAHCHEEPPEARQQVYGGERSQ